MKTDLLLLMEAEEKIAQLEKDLATANAALAQAKLPPVTRLTRGLTPSPPKVEQTMATEPAPGATKTAEQFDAELKAITNPHERAAYWEANSEALKHAHRVARWEESQEQQRRDPTLRKAS